MLAGIISEEFLLKKGFVQMPDGSHSLTVKNGDLCGVVINVDIIPVGTGMVVGIKDERAGFYSILPVRYENQLSKLIDALRGT